MSGPYRKPAERPAVPRDLKRWYTKSGDVEKGPFEAKSILRSARDGYITKTTLVRAEDEHEWRAVAEVFAVTPLVVPPRKKPRARFFYKLGIDGDERGPVSLDRVALLRHSEKRIAFVRAEQSDEWTPYTRYLNRQRAKETKGRLEISDVTRNAMGRILAGVFLAGVGAFASSVSSRIFIGLMVAGLFLIGRGVHRWADGRT